MIMESAHVSSQEKLDQLLHNGKITQQDYQRLSQVMAGPSGQLAPGKLVGSVVLQWVVVGLLAVPLGLWLGTLLGLISDFGPRHTAQNIRANPEIFAGQYAGPIVNSGWAALVCLVVVVVIVGIQLMLMWRRKRGQRGQRHS